MIRSYVLSRFTVCLRISITWSSRGLKTFKYISVQDIIINSTILSDFDGDDFIGRKDLEKLLDRLCGYNSDVEQQTVRQTNNSAVPIQLLILIDCCSLLNNPIQYRVHISTSLHSAV